jgi:hypothetical protein
MRHWTHQALLRCEISEFFSSLLESSVFLASAYCGLIFFVAGFLAVFNAGFCCGEAALVCLASWSANRALNLLRASSSAFNVYFLYCFKMKG